MSYLLSYTKLQTVV